MGETVPKRIKVKVIRVYMLIIDGFEYRFN